MNISFIKSISRKIILIQKLYGLQKSSYYLQQIWFLNVELISAGLWEPTLCIMWLEVSLGTPHLHDQSYITLQHLRCA